MSFWKNLKFPTRKDMKRGQRAELSILPEGIWSTYNNTRIETWRPEPDEVIILRPNRHESVDSYMITYNDLREKFPENPVIIVPEEVEFRHMSNEDLIRYFMDICDLIITIGKEPYASRFNDEDDN